MQAALTKGSLSQIRNRHRVTQFSVGALVLSLYFYRAREVLVCWLLFSFLFFCVTLLISGGLLVCHAYKRATHWTRRLASVTPVLAIHSAKSPLGISSEIGPTANE